MRRQVIKIFVALMLVQGAVQVIHAEAVTPRHEARVVALGRIPPDVFDKESSTGALQSGTRAKVTVRHCRVTSVHDGDSMRVRCPGFRDTLRIRMDKIDAPELDQAYGTQSRDYLHLLCPKDTQAVVHDLGADSYNRRLGRVFCNGEDANAAMVKAGAAWVYDYHASDEDVLYALQKAAQAQKLGLWAGPGKPVPPWEFRYRQRRQDDR